MSYDVIIIGGGLAGCSAAIQLARAGQQVLLLEKKRYPSQKLCGEFLSMEVRQMLERLGVRETITQAGAAPITRARFTTSVGVDFTADLPEEAYGVSRRCLDFLMFVRARELGTRCLDGTPVLDVQGSLEEGFQVSTEKETYRGRAVLGAFGKRSRLDKVMNRSFLDRLSPLVAFKAHYEGDNWSDVIEVHGFNGGYCGIAPIEDGQLNVCWVTQEKMLKEAGGDPEQLLEQHLTTNRHLHDRLKGRTRLSDSFEAVSQVTLQQKPLFENDVAMIGDAAAMIAPLCGDGMAMALRSAELVVPPLTDFLEGKVLVTDYKQQYQEAWQTQFRKRLTLGRWIHRASLHTVPATLMAQACAWVPPLRQWLIRKTRSSESL